MNATRTELLDMTDEYVLGLLDRDAADRIDAALEADCDVIAAVGASRARFLDLDLALDPEPVPPGLWDRVSAALPDNVARFERPATKGTGTGTGWPMTPANRTVAPTRRMVLTGAVAASLGLLVGTTASLWRVGTPPEAAVVAVLEGDDGTPRALIEDYGDDTVRVSFLVEPDVPAGRSMQVWTKPSEEIGPVSLAVLDDARSRVLAGPDLPEPTEAQLYEITFEPEGGSPTGLPTGPILALGLGRVPRS